MLFNRQSAIIWGTMHPAIQPLAAILSLNRRLLLNSLDGMSEKAARARAGDGNSAAFIAVHLIDARMYLLKGLGGAMPHPFGSRLKKVKTIDEMTWYPTLEEIRAAWEAVSARLDARLSKLTAKDLAKKSRVRFPIADRTRLGMLAFLAQHDSYHIGQISLLRRAGGLPPMKY